MIPEDRIRGRVTFDFIRVPDRRVSQRSLLLQATDDMMVLAHELSPHRLEYFGQVVMDIGYWGVWFLFKGKPFDVGRVYRPDGTWMGYYIDVLEPVQWRASNPNTLEPIVDLFLDLWIAPDGKHMVLDEDEFEEAIAVGHLTVGQIGHARSVLQELVKGTQRGEFPPAVAKNFSL
jgi:predicted RNA-binding protein associated with RNAse of E/G family